MDTWDAIRARRNVRSYRPDPVPDSDLQRIAEAGWRSPSASNRQPWDFVIVTDPERLQALSTVWQGARHIASAPAAIALVAPVPPDERRKLLDQYDLGQATMAMMLAATGESLVTPRHRPCAEWVRPAVGSRRGTKKSAPSPPPATRARRLPLPRKRRSGRTTSFAAVGASAARRPR